MKKYNTHCGYPGTDDGTDDGRALLDLGCCFRNVTVRMENMDND